MLAFLARAFVLLAAAFGLGAIGGRTARHRARQGTPSPAAERPSAKTALSDRVLAGAIGDDRGAEKGGSDILGGLPAEQPALPTEPRAADAGGSVAVDAPEGERTDPTGGKENDALNVATGLPVFAGYGGSGVVAGVAQAPWSDNASAADVSSRESSGPAALAAPDVRGRTPSAHERQSLPEDPLTLRHQTDALDFKTVDYGNIKAAERTAAEALSRDDGWTVPEGYQMPVAGEHGESPASFKSGGGSGAVHGAPEPVPLDGPSVDGDDADLADTMDRSATAPSRLDVARGGVPDDLTRILGIGPSIERLLFDNGIFHFDQIAAWTADETRWADALSGFPDRVVRERWIEQAKALAAENQQA